MYFRGICKAAGIFLISIMFSYFPAHVSWTYALDPINVRFKAGDNARGIKIRGIEAISLDRSEARTSAEYNLKKDSAGILWIRLFFPWFNQSAVSVSLRGGQIVIASAMNKKGLRNSGNIDVWHWVPVFRGTLRAGRHRVDVKISDGEGAAVESLTWTESENPWEEGWFSGAEVSRAIKDSKPWSGPENPDAAENGLIIEAKEGVCRAGCQKESVVTLYSDDDFLAIPFKLSRSFKGTLWFRVFLGQFLQG